MIHPVRFHIEPTRPTERDRTHVVIRLLLLVALGAVGFSSLYWIVYLAIPAGAALVLSQAGSERYLRDTAPRLVVALRWIAQAYAYLWLLTDRVPTGDAPRNAADGFDFAVECSGAPTPQSALMRLFTSLPALVAVIVLSFIGGFVWLFGAVAILVTRRMPLAAFDYLASTLRYQMRLVAYHASLTDAYPAVTEAAEPRTV